MRCLPRALGHQAGNRLFIRLKQRRLADCCIRVLLQRLFIRFRCTCFEFGEASGGWGWRRQTFLVGRTIGTTIDVTEARIAQATVHSQFLFIWG